MDSGYIENAADLARALRAIRARKGVTLREIEAASQRVGYFLSRATAGRLEAGTFPTRNQLVAYLRACDASEKDIAGWIAVWERLAPEFPRGRRTTHHLPPTTRQTFGVANRPSTDSANSSVQSPRQVAEAVQSLAQLAEFVTTGDPRLSPVFPRLSVRIVLDSLDEALTRTTLTLRVEFEKPLQQPKFDVYAASSLEALMVFAPDSTLLSEWWILEDESLDIFANVFDSAVKFKTGWRDGGSIRLFPLSEDAVVEVSLESRRTDFGIAESEAIPGRQLSADLERIQGGESASGKVSIVEMTLATTGRTDVGYFAWTVAAPIFLEGLDIDLNEWKALNPSRNIRMHINCPAHWTGQRYRDDQGGHFKIDSWIMQGHGVTLTWDRSTV